MLVVDFVFSNILAQELFKCNDIARLACLPSGLYIFLALILMIARRTIISGYTGPIFIIFSQNESTLGADN